MWPLGSIAFNHLILESYSLDKMTGRHGYEARPERQNEYFIPGDGISREVIQADICRYLGNDALVRPGNHNVCFPVSPILKATKHFKFSESYRLLSY